jgi:hypothetical protein
MLKRLKSFLMARTTVLGALLLLLAAMGTAVLVPQDEALARGAGAMGGGAPPRSFLVGLLGFGHVFSTWWFAALSALFGLQLSLSTFDQFRVCRARTRQTPAVRLDGSPCALPREEVERVLAEEGYRRVAAAPGRTRHVKFWLGYWGSFLLHVGMTVTVLGALVYVLTEHRVVLRAVSGTEVPVGPSTTSVRRGLLAGELPLPTRVSLFRLEPRFREDDQLGDLASHLVFTDREGAAEDVRVGVNDFQDYRGLLVYQQLKIGNAFFLEFRGGPGGGFDTMLALPLPRRRDAASYDTVPLEGPLQLRVKYYANADRSRIMPEHPQLFLRLTQGEEAQGEVALESGQSARLGPWDVRLVMVGWWTEILFEGSRGTPAIFAGFAILLLGGVLTFFSAPREAVVSDAPGGCTLSWRTTRFPEFYREEGARILSRCTGESSP